MELEIISKVHGKFIVYYDDEDHELILRYKWYIRVQKTKSYAATSIYIKEKQNSKSIFMHNLLIGKVGIDHINGNGCDNRRVNLRMATQRQNTKNMKLSVLNKFGVKGVIFDSKKKRYCVNITNDYSHIYLGQFDSLVEAAKKYNEAAIKYHGDFACINKLTPDIEKELRKYDLPARDWGVKKSNTSGYRGVGVMHTGKYYAKIIVNKKQFHLGSFDKKEDAAKAYNYAAIKYLGNNALLNKLT